MRRGPLRKYPKNDESGAGGGPALRLVAASYTDARCRGFSSGSRRARRSSPTAAWARCSRARSTRLRCPEEANLRAPESVIDVHLGYIRAGAELIETNTFGANRAEARAAFPRGRVRADQQRRREARPRGARGLGHGGLHRRLDRAARRRRAARREPARSTPSRRVLEGRGVDLFIVETFSDLDDLETAVAALRSVSSLPIVALMTLRLGAARRSRASRPRRRPRGCAALDVAAFGANHGAGPAAALRALAEMQVGAPLAALPNVGLASMSGQRIVFPHATPEYFGEFAAQARALGARIIGGCCGTTPAQIAAIRAAIDENARAGVAAARPRAGAGERPPCERRADAAPTAARGRRRSSSPCSSTRRSARTRRR